MQIIFEKIDVLKIYDDETLVNLTISHHTMLSYVVSVQPERFLGTVAFRYLHTNNPGKGERNDIQHSWCLPLQILLFAPFVPLQPSGSYHTRRSRWRGQAAYLSRLLLRRCQ